MLSLGQKMLAIGTIVFLELIVFVFMPLIGLIGLVPAGLMAGMILTR
jgi:NADH:ubiquinone oxidoreductase subunit 3 (subunit A)